MERQIVFWGTITEGPTPEQIVQALCNTNFTIILNFETEKTERNSPRRKHIPSRSFECRFFVSKAEHCPTEPDALRLELTPTDEGKRILKGEDANILMVAIYKPYIGNGTFELFQTKPS